MGSKHNQLITAGTRATQLATHTVSRIAQSCQDEITSRTLFLLPTSLLRYVLPLAPGAIALHCIAWQDGQVHACKHACGMRLPKLTRAIFIPRMQIAQKIICIT